MNLLLALLLAQAPLDATIDAFVKGDKDAEAELLKHGAYAIRPLQRARDRKPDRIDDLIFRLKKSAAHPANSQVFDVLDLPKSYTMAREETVGPDLYRHIEALRCSTFVDRIDPKLLKSATFKLRHDSVAARVILDDFCAQTGLDYGVFHNHLVIGHPDRLWPDGPPAAPRKLTDEEAGRVKKLIAQLGAETIDEREAASRELRALGPSVAPALKDAQAFAEAEVVARCAALIKFFEARPRGAFSPSGAERQQRTEEEGKTLKQVQAQKMSFSMRSLPLSHALMFMGEFTGLQIEGAADLGMTAVPMRFQGKSMADALALILQSCDLDYVIRGRTLVVDKREEIEKVLK